MTLPEMTLVELSAQIRHDRREQAATLNVVCLADVQPQAIDWLWPERIARGKVSMIAGDPGLGKSMLTVALASAVSTGARWPVSGGNAPIGSVIMLSAEDSLADTIRPRLDAAEADCSKIYAIEMVRERTAGGEETERSFSLAKDIEILSDLLTTHPDCRLITIDPVSAYLDGTDSHKNSDVRALLSPLSEMAEKHGVAIVTITHLNKGGGIAIYRATGSLAFVAAARSVLGVIKDREDSARRLVLPIKNNLGADTSGLAYRIETARNGSPVLHWEPDAVTVDINEALDNRMDDEGGKRQDAINWLESELEDGPVLTKDLKKNAATLGHSWRTVQRAMKQIGVDARKTGMKGGWKWWHPNDLPADWSGNPEGRHENTEDSQSQGVAAFGDNWRSSGDDEFDQIRI